MVMKQYRSVHFGVYLAVSSLSYLVLSNLDTLRELSPLYGFVEDRFPNAVEPLLASVVVAIITFVLNSSPQIAELLLEKIPVVSVTLRRILAGRHFVEGDWPLVVVSGPCGPDPGTLRYIGFLSIRYRDGELYVHGDDWSPEGHHEQWFESRRSMFHEDEDERKLQYFYRQGSTSEDAPMRGYTEIYFFPAWSRARLLAGEFRDHEHNDVRFYARRLRGRLLGGRGMSAEDKKTAAREVWEELQPQLPQMLGNRISADWR